MTTVINTNIASLIAQNNLANTQNSLTTAITQLSSGLKINSAADDPAGQAIASLLQSQINGLTTAQSNANIGISLAQTGESALSQITNNLQTIRQLAVESSNGTQSAANRASLNQEAQQAIAQINTIASTTQFNGTTLLDGTFGLQNFQIGADAGQTLGLNISSGVKASQIGQISSTTFQLNSSSTGNLSAAGGTLTIDDNGQSTSIGTAQAGTGAGQTANSAFAAAAAINNSDIVGLDATATNNQAFNFTAVGNSSTAADTFSLTLNGQTINTNVAGGTTLTANDLILAINNSGTGVEAAACGSQIILTAADGSNISLSQSDTKSLLSGGLSATTAASAPAGDGTGGLTTALAAGGTSSTASGQLFGSVTLSTANTLALSGSVAGTAELADFSNVAANSTGGLSVVTTGTLAQLSLTTESSSQTAIEIVDAALNQVSTLQGQLGSVQNRFTSTISNLTASTQNATSAQSTIQDADFASATASLSRAQVLSQAATAIIAQANQLPNQVLKLLQ
ncbi:flagellin [Burkholderia sp. L27(2015)]|uniref:flagellin N-terminal helical domain-containing protein n=1 Tax=Burkholderia sp. L27(2015) TaxID=1641858 RepID=UPI00131CE5ED|nr:flagellin [Burkholderia sp. L27(2015)]